jgi:hypothetical protein
MRPYKLIKIGDIYNPGFGRNERVVIDKCDEEKLICVKMIPRSVSYPDVLNRPIWLKNTDMLFRNCVMEGFDITKKETTKCTK